MIDDILHDTSILEYIYRSFISFYFHFQKIKFRAKKCTKT